MLESLQIVQTAEQSTAAIRLLIPREQIRSVMGPSIHEVMATVAAQGRTPTGPWFTYHFRPPTEVFDFEVGVPVDAPITPAARVKPSVLPAAKAATAVYVGDYEGLGTAWCEFMAWIEAQGLKPGQALWEHYAVGPETTADPARWRTELFRPFDP